MYVWGVLTLHEYFFYEQEEEEVPQPAPRTKQHVSLPEPEPEIVAEQQQVEGMSALWKIILWRVKLSPTVTTQLKPKYIVIINQ